MSTTPATRPAPPALEFYEPDCSVCGTETCCDGDSRWCERCGATWDIDGEAGAWSERHEPLCDSRFREDGVIHRCCLPAQPVHERHYNPEVCGSWHTIEQIDTGPRRDDGHA